MRSLYIFLLCFLCHFSIAETQILPQQYIIDTCMGTAANTTVSAETFGKHSEEYGQTLPAVLMSYGMNFWTSQAQNAGNKCITLYYYKDYINYYQIMGDGVLELVMGYKLNKNGGATFVDYTSCYYELKNKNNI